MTDTNETISRLNQTVQTLQSQVDYLQKLNNDYKSLAKQKVQHWIFEAIGMYFSGCFAILLIIGLVVQVDLVWQIAVCNLGAGLTVGALHTINLIRKRRNTEYLE